MSCFQHPICNKFEIHTSNNITHDFKKSETNNHCGIY